MTPRERLIAVFNGEIPDRVPVSFFVQEEFLSYYYPDRLSIRRLEEAVDCARELDFDLMVRSKNFEAPHFMKKSFSNWELNSYERVQGDNLYSIFEVKTPKGSLKQIEVGPNLKRTGSGIHRSISEYLIKDEKDLEIFSRYVPALDEETIAEMREYAEKCRYVLGNTGVSVPWGWTGVYNQASNYRDVQELMMDPYINPDFYSEYMEKMTELIIEFNTALASQPFDGIGIQGNIANSGVVGKEFFDTHILPYESRLVQTIKSKGKFTVYHNCGRARVLQNSYVDMGITAWETIAEAPQGDNNLEEAKREVGDKLVLIGNIDQLNFLKTAERAQIHSKVEEIIRVGKPGGKYIFAASDFLEKDTPIENIVEAVEAAKYYGKYEK